MARFKWEGEQPRPTVIEGYGPTTSITFKLKDGTKQTVSNPTGFVVGADIGADVTDERALRTARVDPRLSEIV